MGTMQDTTTKFAFPGKQWLTEVSFYWEISAYINGDVNTKCLG